MKNIAVIGVGISGRAAAYFLSRRHRVQPPSPDGSIDERRVLPRFVSGHPLFTRKLIAAQQRCRDVSGINRTQYCGAHCFHGFHEDGLNSALRVAAAFQGPW
jgi:predicted NAD/FAD-binding protein